VVNKTDQELIIVFAIGEMIDNICSIPSDVWKLKHGRKGADNKQFRKFF
jgi:hypothetical protein